MSLYKNGILILSKQEFDDLNYRINNPTKEEQRARTNFFDNLTKNIHIIEESHCLVVAEIDDFDDSFMDKISD